MHFSRNKPSSRVNVTTARQPISAESITKSIRLSINNYQSNATRNKNNGRRIENGTLAIENMTTNDFADDFRAHFTYHEKLLHDIMFMHTYWTAIVGNAHLFKNQIIVDVRCGLGVLSMFCVIAGAKHVYAIEDSAIVQLAKRIIQSNGFDDKITIIQGKVANITLPVEKVDGIVSRCFGQNLFIYNTMNELLDARDKWLKPNGLLLPDRLTFHLAAMSFTFSHTDYWQNVYDFRMDCMSDFSASEPFTSRVINKHIITDASTLANFNLYTVQKNDINGLATCFRLKCKGTGTIGAFFTHFTVHFSSCVQPLQLSSASNSYETLWKPLIFPLKQLSAFPVKLNQDIYGIFRMVKGSADTRKIDWHIEYCYTIQETSLRENLHFVSS